MSALKNLPLMPKATAIWLLENTALTFKQIGDFCGIHEYEVKAMADGDVAQGIKGINPILTGQLTKEEIARCSADPMLTLSLNINSIYEEIRKNKKKKSNYTPRARRQNKPDAILWLLKHYPAISDSLIIQLIGTTKKTIQSIREGSHRDMNNLKARDPVLLGICSQSQINDLDSRFAIQESEAQTKEQEKAP